MPNRPRLAEEVLSYFLKYPEAADDLEGVAHWRLVEEAIHRRVDDTRDALDWLVKQGFLRQESTTKGPLFSLESDNRRKAEDFLSTIVRDEKDR